MKINVYDFDKTLTYKDTLSSFYYTFSKSLLLKFIYLIFQILYKN